MRNENPYQTGVSVTKPVSARNRTLFNKVYSLYDKTEVHKQRGSILLVGWSVL
jgi:hypothetical protein